MDFLFGKFLEDLEIVQLPSELELYKEEKLLKIKKPNSDETFYVNFIMLVNFMKKNKEERQENIKLRKEKLKKIERDM